jgi:hypothetical protein
MRTMGLGQRQPLVGRKGGPDLVALKTKHSRKCVGDTDIVIDNEHTSAAIARSHALIVGPGSELVKVSRRHVLYSAGFALRLLGDSTKLGLRFSSEVLLSPILVRPVREQLEHDRVIRLLQAKYKRKFEVAVNPGSEQNMPVGSGPSAWYPDLVLQSPERGRKLQGVVEVETAESVNNLEAMSQWTAFSKLRVPFYLYIPAASVEVARRLCSDLQISVAEIWAYHPVGDQIRFTLVHRAPVEAVKPAPAEPSPPRARAAEAAPTGRRAVEGRLGRRSGTRDGGRKTARKPKSAPRRSATRSAGRGAKAPVRKRAGNSRAAKRR